MVKVIDPATVEALDMFTDVDSLVGLADPARIMAGGAFDGAKRLDSELAGWHPGLNSADLDILPDKDVLDARSRDSVRNDAYLQGGQTIHKDSIVGAFYFLNAKPETSILTQVDSSLNEVWAEEFQSEVESKFTLWAESPQAWVDAARQNNFTSMIRLGVGVYSAGSELLATSEWDRDPTREINTCIQMIDCDRLSTPPEAQWDENVRAGVRMNDRGAPQSAYIRVKHPSDYRSIFGAGALTWKEVPWRKPWGRQQVIYLREQMRIDQTRAVSDIVAGLKEIAITRKFRDVTLQNAVANALFAASIESELPPQAVYEQLNGGGTAEAVTEYAAKYLSAVGVYANNAQNLRLDGVRIPHLFPGTKLQLRPAGTSGGLGQNFEISLLRYIAAALGVSYEELSRDFSKTNYSSVRAAMAQSWRFMQNRKRIAADGLANATFRLWLEEVINKDMLRTFPASKAALLYTNGVQNLVFEALCQCDWIGAARGQIDELKETQAAVLRIKFGLSTHEDELARLGKNWQKVYIQLERERKERKKRGIELIEDNSVNAASGSPRDQGDGSDGAANDQSAAA